MSESLLISKTEKKIKFEQNRYHALKSLLNTALILLGSNYLIDVMALILISNYNCKMVIMRIFTSPNKMAFIRVGITYVDVETSVYFVPLKDPVHWCPRKRILW